MMIRNTNDKNGVSPSKIMFARPIKDHLPLMEQQGKDIDQHWKALWRYKEKSNAKHRQKNKEKMDKLGRRYTTLEVDQYVSIENVERTSSFAKTRWTTFGWIKEILPYEQYLIKLQTTGEEVKRNRKHIKLVTTGEDSSQTSDPGVSMNNINTSIKGHELTLPSSTYTGEYGVSREQVPPKINCQMIMQLGE